MLHGVYALYTTKFGVVWSEVVWSEALALATHDLTHDSERKKNVSKFFITSLSYLPFLHMG